MTTSDDHRQRPPAPLPVHTVHDAALGNRSYVVDVGAGAAVTIDVPRQVDAACAVAASNDLRVVAALDTHLHGDFVSGARELGGSLGSSVVAPARAGLEYPHRAAGDGTVILVGDVEVHACATPGHGDEHTVYVVVVDHVPVAVFAGGLLAEAIRGGDDGDDDDVLDAGQDRRVVDVRTPTERGLGAIGDLDPSVPLYLTHADALDGAWPTTVGEALAQFRRRGGAHPWPAASRREISTLRALNRRGPRLLDVLTPPRPLSPQEVFRLATTGTWLVDARQPSEWAAGHPPLALSVAYGTSFRRRLPHVVPPGAPVMLVIDDGVDPDAVISEARACGHDDVIGWLAGGFALWKTADLPVVQAESVARRAVRLHAQVVDVSEDSQPSVDLRVAHRLPLAALAAGDLPRTDGQPVVVIGDDPAGTATAASILEARGITAAVAVVDLP